MQEPMPSIQAIMDTIVPITRFNRGEASKIFDEVNASGVKVVLKNNLPTCVLVQPDRYEDMVEALEDYALFFEAERRIQNDQTAQTVSFHEVMQELDMTDADLLDVEVEIE